MPTTRSSAGHRGAPRLSALLRRPPPCLELAGLPTPVQRVAWLDAGGREVWIKRDDLSSETYGGGKVRKLEWSLASPPFDGAEAITSMGGIGSNHLVALALFLGDLGRHLHALVFDQPLTEHVRTNLAVMASLGSTFWYVHRRWQLPATWVAYHLSRRGDLGRYMEPGGSTPLGCFGFVEAGLELAAQVEGGELPAPRTIFITGGTGGASAGLALGLALAGLPTHLHIVSAVEPTLFNRVLMSGKLWAVHRVLRRHGLSVGGSPFDLLDRVGVSWTIDHAHVGRGYGAPTDEGRRAVALAAINGIALDPTYTGKCVAALRTGDDPGPVLFWNTHAATDIRARIEPDWESRLPPRLRRHLARAPWVA